MKIGLISDIHGNLHALEKVLSELQARHVEMTLCAGDLVCYGAHPNEVIERLIQHSIPSVIGNYDAAVAWNLASASRKPSSLQTEPIKQAVLDWTKRSVKRNNVDYLRSLSWTMWHRFENRTIQLLHAGLDNLDEWYGNESTTKLTELVENTAADILVLGHTHQQFTFDLVRSTGQETLVINPGSIGRSLDGDPRAAYAVLDLETLQVELLRTEYDLDGAMQAITKSGMPSKVAKLMRCAVRRVEDLDSKQ